METDEARITLDRRTRGQLEDLVGDGNTPQKIAKRARVVLMTAQGHGVTAIMRAVGVSKTRVRRWQDYFVEAGVEGLIQGRSKPPGKKPIGAAIKLEVVAKTVKERPANATHWSVRRNYGDTNYGDSALIEASFSAKSSAFVKIQCTVTVIAL